MNTDKPHILTIIRHRPTFFLRYPIWSITKGQELAKTLRDCHDK